MDDNEREILTPRQTADLLQISLATLYKWTHMKFIPHLKLQHAVRFERSEVMRWLKKRRQSVEQRPNVHEWPM